MPLINLRSSLGANAEDTPLTRSQYERLPFNALVEFAILADAGGVVNASVFSGTDVLLQDSQIDNLPVATSIQYPENFTLQDVAAMGEKLGENLRETAGAAGPTIVRTQVRITPL